MSKRKRFLMGLFILVVDDFECTLEDIGIELRHFFEADKGHVVTLMNNSSKVIDQMKAWKEEGKPVSVLVLDLLMPGKNGDELIRDLAQESLLVPIVIHSGSHAGVLHSSFFNFREKIAVHHSRIPILFLEKYGLNYERGSLAESIKTVLSQAANADWNLFASVAKEFTVKSLSDSPDFHLCEELSQAVRLVSQRSTEVKLLFLSKLPQLCKGRKWEYFDLLVNDLRSPDYSVRGLMETSEGRGAVRRHRLPSVVNHPGLAAMGIVEEGIEEHSFSNPLMHDVKNEVQRFGSLCKRVCRHIKIIRLERTEPAIHAVEPMMKNLCRRMNVQFHSEAEIKHVTLFKVDIVVLIVEQLIANALEATDNDNGAVKVVLRNFCSDEISSDYILLSVVDKGGGIRSELQSKIFENGFSTKLDGTGFGLAYANTFIEKLGGSIHFETNAHGTTFNILLPAFES